MSELSSEAGCQQQPSLERADLAMTIHVTPRLDYCSMLSEEHSEVSTGTKIQPQGVGSRLSFLVTEDTSLQNRISLPLPLQPTCP